MYSPLTCGVRRRESSRDLPARSLGFRILAVNHHEIFLRGVLKCITTLNDPVLHLTRLAFIYGCMFVPRVLPCCISPAWFSFMDACLYQGCSRAASHPLGLHMDACLYQGCSRAASHLLYGERYQLGIRLALIPLADRSENTQRPFGVFRIPATKKYSLVSLDTFRCCDMSSNPCGRLGRGHFCGSQE